MISISSLLTYFFAISIMLISGSIQGKCHSSVKKQSNLAVEDHAIKIALLIGYIAVGAWSFLVVGSTKELLEAEIQTITSSSSATASSTVPSNS